MKLKTILIIVVVLIILVVIGSMIIKPEKAPVLKTINKKTVAKLI